MGRQLWLPDILADEFRGVKGFRVDTYPGFMTRGITDFFPCGVMDHHTGPGSYNALLNYMAVGPVHPPLCNYSTSRPIEKLVRITIVALGRANHAGVGELSWLGVNGGNRNSIGGEHQNDGKQTWPEQQLEAMRRSAAAILRYLKVDASRRTDHKIYGNRPPGWPGRKPDRHTLSQSTENAVVNKYIKRVYSKPEPEKENIMAQLDTDDYTNIAKAIANHISPRNGRNQEYHWRKSYELSEEALAIVKALAAQPTMDRAKLAADISAILATEIDVEIDIDELTARIGHVPTAAEVIDELHHRTASHHHPPVEEDEVEV